MNINPEDPRLDLDVILQHLLTHARDNPRLALALQRQTRRVMDTLDEILSPAPADSPVRNDNPPADTGAVESIPPPDAPAPVPPADRAPPASPEKLASLLDWKGGEPRAATGPAVLVQGKPLARKSALTESHQDLAEHCHLKARAAAWRVRSLLGEEDARERQDLVKQAREADIFLWPLDPTERGPQSRQEIDYQRFSDACDACTVALDAWTRLSNTRPRDLLPLIAEAQSMMRVAAAGAGYARREDTADAVHEWLCETRQRMDIRIERFMKQGDPADPDSAADLQERVLRLLKPTPAPAGNAMGTGRGEDAGVDEDDEEEVPTPEVARVRELLAGKTVAMFCGDRRPLQQQKLVEAFGLRELIWEDLSETYRDGDHARIFNRKDLALVLVAVTLARTVQIYTLPKLAESRGIPAVRLKAGYGVNRVAHEILAQVSEKLAESA